MKVWKMIFLFISGCFSGSMLIFGGVCKRSHEKQMTTTCRLKVIEEISIPVAKGEPQDFCFQQKHISAYFYVNFYCFLMGKVMNS